ncbi:methyl-accepting chemotaxis protein [Coralloluteibacterium stylophorae]|uniref:Type IV pili methyl-accepting chemotaxis transducer N-terminal domain-containing protein n=3 Tax=Coralloluteibacterium stylophorae TaxID=1776034 RepID=A0AAP2FYT0_9GAMM|nr:methyl-accepting chemotaxis protein [Coralloluteibacterium stylophorae]MBS7456090.1 type IV pili methyl-accepting chemotaxis transducer N-terminal domain-containing protein [Coralloluteibacterium stylophorae]
MSSAAQGAGGRVGGIGAPVWIGLLAIFLVLFGVNTAYTLYLGAGESTAAARVADIQVQSQQLAKFAGEAVNGNAEAFGEFSETYGAINNHLQALNAAYGGEGGRVQTALDKLMATWNPMSSHAQRIIDGEQKVLALADTANAFTARVPRLQADLDEVVRAMANSGASSDQVLIAARQLVLIDRMSRRVTEIRAGGAGAIVARDALQNDAAMFGSVLGGLQNGNPELNYVRLTSESAQAALEPVTTAYSELQADIASVVDASVELYEVQQSAAAISEESNVLLDDARSLYEAISALPTTRLFPGNWFGAAFGLLAILSLVGLLVTLSRDQRRRTQDAELQNMRNQKAIQQLLDEIIPIAEGDLTINPTVSEEYTGAIADSISYTVDELRTLVGTINETSVQVSAAAQETQATAMHLAEAAEHQAQQISSSSAKISEIALSIDEVSKNSAESADVAQRSVQIAAKGADVVRQTIHGMDNIRDQIQETSKRIKRLGESSQEIGSIVELINDIAEQTNILALNAAIQAASAGEAGRGFAVVADEVQRLAERSSNATRRIETLVQTIQSDTNEAVSSMEQTTSEVVAGARLAEDAGLALGEIEKVSTDLSDLIQNISSAARQQSAAATNITATMNSIQEITSQTSHGANQTAESIGNLAQLAADMRRSVAKFKLPG